MYLAPVFYNFHKPFKKIQVNLFSVQKQFVRVIKKIINVNAY